jgi:hypothetical protein
LSHEQAVFGVLEFIYVKVIVRTVEQAVVINFVGF